MADAIQLMAFVTPGSSAELPCAYAADVNDDSNVNFTDALTLLGFLFQANDPDLLAQPFPMAGLDPTPTMAWVPATN